MSEGHGYGLLMLPEELLSRVFREVSESRGENPPEDPNPSDNCYVVRNSLGLQVDCSFSKVNELRDAELSYDPAEVMQMLSDADGHSTLPFQLCEEDFDKLEATWTWEHHPPGAAQVWRRFRTTHQCEAPDPVRKERDPDWASEPETFDGSVGYEYSESQSNTSCGASMDLSMQERTWHQARELQASMLRRATRSIGESCKQLGGQVAVWLAHEIQMRQEWIANHEHGSFGRQMLPLLHQRPRVVSEPRLAKWEMLAHERRGSSLQQGTGEKIDEMARLGWGVECMCTSLPLEAHDEKGFERVCVRDGFACHCHDWLLLSQLDALVQGCLHGVRCQQERGAVHELSAIECVPADVWWVLDELRGVLCVFDFEDASRSVGMNVNNGKHNAPRRLYEEFPGVRVFEARAVDFLAAPKCDPVSRAPSSLPQMIQSQEFASLDSSIWPSFEVPLERGAVTAGRRNTQSAYGPLVTGPYVDLARSFTCGLKLSSVRPHALRLEMFHSVYPLNSMLFVDANELVALARLAVDGWQPGHSSDCDDAPEPNRVEFEEEVDASQGSQNMDGASHAQLSSDVGLPAGGERFFSQRYAQEWHTRLSLELVRP